MFHEKDPAELRPKELELLSEAERALNLAYAPYSLFRVGAALLTRNGTIVLGANQENASYPMCMCGERVAVYNYAMQFINEPIEMIAIAVSSEARNAKAAAPCGACLQVLSEYEMRQSAPVRLILKGDVGPILET